MLKVGDYVAFKPKLVLGKKYGTVTFGRYHVPYLHKLLRVYKISSANTVYCNSNGYPCDCGTISEPMLNVAKFRIGDIVRIVYALDDKQQPYIGKISTIKSIEYRNEEFIYHITDDCGFFDWGESCLELCTKPDVKQVSKVLEDNENQLQGEDSYLRSGEGVQGSRVHGGKGKASIRSRPLRNASRVRGK